MQSFDHTKTKHLSLAEERRLFFKEYFRRLRKYLVFLSVSFIITSVIIKIVNYSILVLEAEITFGSPIAIVLAVTVISSLAFSFELFKMHKNVMDIARLKQSHTKVAETLVKFEYYDLFENIFSLFLVGVIFLGVVINGFKEAEDIFAPVDNLGDSRVLEDVSYRYFSFIIWCIVLLLYTVKSLNVAPILSKTYDYFFEFLLRRVEAALSLLNIKIPTAERRKNNSESHMMINANKDRNI